MTYELHGDFIIPASKYYVEVNEHSFIFNSVFELQFPHENLTSCYCKFC